VLMIAIPIAIIVIAGVLYAMRQRRTGALRARFGPEYDRVLEARGKREAELDLARREQRARSLQIRPLTHDERLRYAERWAALQRRFVDEPATTVRDAHLLLEEVMRERGYPTHNFNDEVELVSVHHPRSVQHYRAAYALAQQRGTGDGATEDNRQAMLHYRSLFEDLLELETAETQPLPRQPRGPDQPRAPEMETRQHG
jgi:hypothetical protein